MHRMTFGALLAAALALTVTASLAGASDVASDAERYIISSEKQWLPTNPHESDVIARILADDFIGLIDGRIYTKPDALSSAKHDPGSVASEHVDYVNVRFHGMTAIAQGQAIVKQKNGHKVRNRFIDTWVFENRTWRIVAAADTDSPF
ncbi:MAG: nuclear transport factor 2 family protein [Candidatus Cybelea sp.]